MTLRLLGKTAGAAASDPVGIRQALLSGCALPMDDVSASAARICEGLGLTAGELRRRWEATLTSEAPLSKLLPLARQDYRCGRVLLPGGWLLSRTETEILAMLWHARAR
jgi:hypothetical protein